MPKDYKFDPTTGDLVRDGKGGFVLVDTAETAMQEQINHHYQEWWGAPEQGSRVHDLRSFGRDKAKAVADELRRALRRLEAAGRISNIQVIADPQKNGRIVAAATSRDTGTGQPISAKTGV
jgi:phage gp46-like protein